MSAALAIGKWLLKQLATDPEKLVKVFLGLIAAVFALFLLVVVVPFTLFSSVPSVNISDQGQKYVELYKEVAEDLKQSKNVEINTNYLIAIDAVIYKQDFANVDKNHIKYLANYFLKSVTVRVKHTKIENGKKVVYYTEEKQYVEVPLQEAIPKIKKRFKLTDTDLKLIQRYLSIGIPGTGSNDSSEGCTNCNVPLTPGTFNVPAIGVISSGFGWRFGGSDFHPGIDLASHGTVPIGAAADGIVQRSYLSTSYGNCVMIVHNIDGQVWETVYAHMRNRLVSQGEHVKRGQIVGYMGSTGDSTGQHLHFELHHGYWNYQKSNAVNPALYINFGQK